MAVTQGHGNPSWGRDETILALELYLQSDMGRRRTSDPAVQALSNLLRSLSAHDPSAKNEHFRNPAGVAFKLQNLRSVETGKGLKNVSAMDRAIMSEFAGQPEEVARLAALIRAGIEAGPPEDSPGLEDEFYEGSLLTRQHYSRERSQKIRTRLLNLRSISGLSCDICGVQYSGLPTKIRESAFEAHHVVPISAGERVTRLRDMALLCACCHRLTHRLIATERRWFDIDEARNILFPSAP